MDNHASLQKAVAVLRSEKIVTAPGWENFLHSSELAGVAAVYKTEAGERFTRSGSTEVRRILLKHGTETRAVFIKKYWANNFRQMWSGALRGTFFGRSKARREYENMSLLRRWGLDAPEPVAYGEERTARWLKRSFLMSAEISNPVPLQVFIRDVLPTLPEAERRRTRLELIEKLADYTRRMHEHRFVHHDYFWRNIILNGTSLEHFSLIDAHKGRCWSANEHANRARDLAALDSAAPEFFRRTERLRFFLRYAGVKTLRGEDKQIIRHALRFAEPQRERQIRRALEEGRAGINK
jgi:tRNA A-37 threonylcarbamoyl transferase component Bud32